MTDVQDTIDTIEKSDVYKEFHSKNDSYVLAHVFCHVRQKEESVEVGYYSSSDDKIVVFACNPVTLRPPEEAFKDSTTILPLDLHAVAIGIADARLLAREYREKEYSAHPVSQEICILQQAEYPLWNITLVTETLNFLNVKFDARDGTLVSSQLRNILDLRKNNS